MTDSSASSGTQDLVARAGRYYRNARYVLVAAMVVVGLWFAYDGWVTYPADNRVYDSRTPEQRAGGKARHPELDITIQRRLAIALIAATFPMLAWVHYRSRGEYRLSGMTLHVPGHPPVPFEAIVAMDKAKWQRKGIVYVEYQLEGSGRPRRLTLDDFIYSRGPTDEIVARIEKWLVAQAQGNPSEEERHQSEDATER
jgi:hypothetical protein